MSYAYILYLILILFQEYILRRSRKDQLDYIQAMQTQEGKAEFEVELEEDAGCSKALAVEFEMEKRMPIYLIHGFLHLLGYDHETDEDWGEMTSKEEEVLRRFRETKV
jgi:rRNA maturation RNase YbeY